MVTATKQETFEDIQQRALHRLRAALRELEPGADPEVTIMRAIVCIAE